MAFEIVDGMTGTKHISSDDLAALNTATVGKADCVLEYGNDFALSMASANTATLGTGVGMVGGKRFWNQAATSLTIQSGTQGQKRNDLVVARYAKTSAGIESITPVVIKGTPTMGTPADPNTTANDLKLWRVPLDGINAGTPVRLFEPVTPLATLGDSVSHGGEQPFAGGYLYRFGPLYVLQIQNMTLQANVPRTVGKLPVKPTREVVGAISYGISAGYVSVHEDGTVYCTSRASGDFSGQVCFLAG